MTRLGFVADVHLGNHKRFGGPVQLSLNQRCRDTLDVLKRAVDRAIETKCTALTVLGDLFDVSRPEAQLIAEAQRIFARAESEGIDVLLLVGNHDQVSTDRGDHALGPLLPYCQVIDAPTRIKRMDWNVELFCIPFQPGLAREWMPAALDAMMAAQGGDDGRVPSPPGAPRVLALHLGVIDEKTPPWLAASGDAIHVDLLRSLCEKHHIEAAFAGNWHDRRQWKGNGQPGHLPRIFQVGALVPTGFDNPGLDGYGTLAFWEVGRVTYEELAGPRFLKVDDHDTLNSDELKKHKVYLSVTSLPEDMGHVGEALTRSIERGDVVAGEVLPDEQVAEAEARTAAQTARSADTLQEALSGFVREMPVPEKVSRERVLELSRGYLGC